ncbi:FtsK/SpoIIIE domain-containing protein [Clostridium thailandense]|uniref:FtsK/SpoIIIE domain-containing protein n=1 Tax=Clostridium thailandense TaxID=2794346 RepID=UPI003988EDD5
MSVIKLHTYCGNTCSALILDSTRQGRKTIQIDRTLSDLSNDMSYAVDCAQDKFTIFADYFEFKAGGPYLTPGSFIEITSLGLKMAAVVTDIGSSEHYNYFSIRGKTEISIGRSNPCTICYNYGNFISNKPHCRMHYDKTYGTYILENTCGSPSVYVNNSRIDGIVPLYFGDEISILGLSIVFLGAVLAVNNPSQMMTTNLQPSRDDIFNAAKPAVESEFTRSTRIYKSPVSENFSIDPPISKNQQQKLPVALTVGPAITMGVSVLSSMMISLSSASSSGSSPLPGLIMSGTMLVGMFVWPGATRRWQDKKEKEEEALRKKNYMDYIDKTKEKIVEKVQYNLNLFDENLTASSNIAEWIFDERLSRRIWERSYYDKDFTEVRLGVGRRKNLSQIEIPRAGYLSENDELNQLALLLKEEFEYIENSPVSIDLKHLNSVGLIGAYSLVSQMAINMAFQLAALHDSSELKMIFIYNEKNKKSFEWVKKLPHVWNNDTDFRFIAKDKDELDLNAIYNFATAMTLFKSDTGKSKAGIPTTVTFLDLFKAATIEEINILSRWSESNSQKSLAVPIGIKNGGELFKLDIHEKYHGSHGLMAGTTGSGKSECIQSIILSLAVHFHPDDVSFVLIDFKGGGMANCFIGMPHIAGTITNLGKQIRRSMISLNSELKRRQNMLKEAGVNHIDEYQALFKNGTVELPMPHLVIVSDEFAELKQQRVSLIDGCGEIVASAEIKAIALENTKKQSQLEAVVSYFEKISIENNIKPNLIWQEPLKSMLSLSEITLYNGMIGEEVKKENFVLPVLGIIDDPEIQRQHPLTIDLSIRGHLVLYGMPGSGKTTFLQTLLYSTISTYKAEDIHFTILDFGGRVLELFSSAPHTDSECILSKISKLFPGKSQGSRKEKVSKENVNNDINKMAQHHKKACKLMCEPSRVLDTESNWTFGSPSVLYLFYRETGKLEKHVNDMVEALPCYKQLTNEHGNGAEHVMKAEWYFNIGDFENAEIATHKALYKAQLNMEMGIIICIMFLQIRIALIKGEFSHVLQLLQKMREIIKNEREYSFIYTIDMCESYVYSLVKQNDKVPKWIERGDFNSKHLLFPTISMLNI